MNGTKADPARQQGVGHGGLATVLRDSFWWRPHGASGKRVEGEGENEEEPEP